MKIVPLAEVERRHILNVLRACGGNKRMAAEGLKMDRRTLYRRLDVYEDGLVVKRKPRGVTAAASSSPRATRAARRLR